MEDGFFEYKAQVMYGDKECTDGEAMVIERDGIYNPGVTSIWTE